ncbi:uncharacterized protein LOC115624929 [Scaptodrosophila lebanonensis]|uniref:Uncharacterized protein LOC115624929 n=1 Tax=Drosophila lebanonensis TaxID=7225 RepID=A0A6J2TJK3_DROLE|nr:uncharacterized protein LOC115624929 [Scaptodrosophila lebanonensis]
MTTTIAFVLVAPDIPFGILYLIPTYSAIAALHSVCIHASSYRFCTEENSKKYADCSLHPHVPCIWPALPYLLVLLFSTVLFFSVILLCERGSNCVSDSRFRGGMIIDDHCNIRNMTRNELRNHPLVLKNVKTDYVKAHHPIKGVSFGMKP